MDTVVVNTAVFLVAEPITPTGFSTLLEAGVRVIEPTGVTANVRVIPEVVLMDSRAGLTEAAITSLDPRFVYAHVHVKQLSLVMVTERRIRVRMSCGLNGCRVL